MSTPLSAFYECDTPILQISKMKHLQITPGASGSPLREAVRKGETPEALPEAKEVKVHPSQSQSGDENASIYFVGTATTIM